MYKFICILTIVSALAITSCGNDGVDCDDQTALSNIASQAVTNYSNSLNTFSADPTKANCEAVIKATEQYIDDIDSIIDCVPSDQRGEFIEDLDELRDLLANAECE